MEEQNVLDGTQEQVVDVPNEQATEVVEIVAEVETEVVDDTNTEVVDSEVVPEQQEEVEKKEVKPVQSKEENSKFAEQRRKYEKELEVARQEARDKMISEQYGASHNIHTEAQYKQALETSKRNKEIAAMTRDGKMDKQTAAEIIEARRIKEEVKAEKAELERSKQKAEKIKSEGLEFLSYYKKVNGKAWDGDSDKLPQEVLDAVNNGEKLKYAYMDYRETQNKKAQEVASNNAKIKETETGSVVGNGTPEVALTEAMIADMSPSELMERWDEVKKVTRMK